MGTRRRLTRRGFIGLGAAAAAGVAYSGLVERRWLAVERVDVPVAGLPPGLDGVRLVQLSDLHLPAFEGHYARAAKLALDLAPDLICVTGDLVAPDGRLEPVAELLAALRAPAGVVVCLGNWEHWTGRAGEMAALCASAGARLLVNDASVLDLPGGRLAVAATDDGLAGRPNPRRALRDVPSGCPTVLMTHSPAHADSLGSAPVDLILAGHTHGGQVRLPVLGAPLRPPGSGRFTAGLYRASGGQPLYVNRGIGTSVLPVRLGCRPEVTVLTLRREAG